MRDASTAPLMVPTDLAFRDDFEFTVRVAPDIYDVFSNIDSEYNADIDKSLGISGWQIGDVDAWRESAPGESDRDRELLRAVVDDAIASSGAGTAGPCIQLQQAEGAGTSFQCESDGQEFAVHIAAGNAPAGSGRRAIIVLPDSDAARRYVAQAFEVVELDQAADLFTTRAR